VNTQDPARLTETQECLEDDEEDEGWALLMASHSAGKDDNTFRRLMTTYSREI